MDRSVAANHEYQARHGRGVEGLGIPRPGAGEEVGWVGEHEQSGTMPVQCRTRRRERGARGRKGGTSLDKAQLSLSRSVVLARWLAG